MIADSGEAFRPGGLQRQQQGQYQHHQQSLEQHHRQWQEQSMSSSPTAIQDQPPDVLPYPDRTFHSQYTSTTDDEQTATLSQETILKIEELKRLIYRYSQYHRNPGAVIGCVVYYCNSGDNTLLDEKLKQLRTFHTHNSEKISAWYLSEDILFQDILFQTSESGI
jgi:hypothetical protein